MVNNFKFFKGCLPHILFGSILNTLSHVITHNQFVASNKAQKMKFSIKYLFSKCEQTTGNCGFGHIYLRNP